MKQYFVFAKNFLVNNSNPLLKNNFLILVITGIVLNSFGLFNAILEPDGTLYASIAKHIAVTNDWVNLIGYGTYWLDKPHFPFWITAISFKLFGISAFAYKLPSFIFWIAGIYYIYLLASDLYNKNVAQLAVIIYVTSVNIILCNLDVRAEGFLITLIIAAIYHIHAASKKTFSWHIVYAALYCACAMMTKGIFVLVTIMSGFIACWLLTKHFKEFMKLKWWLLILLSFIFIIPELYCLYVQFDLHPEKIVYGATNVSGIKFFFWDSQFGRFFNNGPIKGSGNPLFFFHTALWAFLPWSIMLYIAVAALFFNKRKYIPDAIIITISALITFIMFSLSKFQLPYYILIIFPHFSIITADWIWRQKSLKLYSRLNAMLYFLFFILLALSVLLVTVFRAANLYVFYFLCVLISIGMINHGNKHLPGLKYKSICFALLLSAFLNISFYPELLKYQSGITAAEWMRTHEPLYSEVTMYRCMAHTSFAFYNGGDVRITDTLNLPAYYKQRPIVIYSCKTNIDSLVSKGYSVKVLQSFPYFHTSKLTMKFIMPSTRDAQLQTFQLAQIH